MNAHDLMSADVVRVAPDTPLREVAKTLLAHQISAVPVVDEAGSVVGMVSEGDLIGRRKTERETRSEWWLTRLAEGEPISPEFLEHIQGPLAVAREVMSSPVLTVSEDTRADEIASLMATHRVKRVPVVRDGRLVGIVRRADLLRAIGGGPSAPVPLPLETETTPATVSQADGALPEPGHAQVEPAPPPSPDEPMTADGLRHLVAHHGEELNQERSHQQQHAAEARRRALRHLVETHISDGSWNEMIHHARDAAARGETESLLLRFPSQLCADGGRAINAPDAEWPATLRGEAAEIYLRWERDLRPLGFHMIARVIEFPGGLPGDIGLYLVW